MQSCSPGPGLPPVKAGLLSAAVMFQPVIVGPLAGLGQISRPFSQAIEPPPRGTRYLTSVSKTHDRSAAVSACLCSSEGTLSSKRVCKCACVCVFVCVCVRAREWNRRYRVCEKLKGDTCHVESCAQTDPAAIRNRTRRCF